MDSLIEKIRQQRAQAAIDPFMLMSYVNMKLRDEYSSLDLFCDDLNVSRSVIEELLASIGMEYNPQTNKFW